MSDDSYDVEVTVGESYAVKDINEGITITMKWGFKGLTPEMLAEINSIPGITAEVVVW